MSIKNINPFSVPHDIWKKREPTNEERQEMIKRGTWKPFVSINVQIDKTISNPMDAAEFLAACQHDSRLDRFVIKFLDESNEYSKWLSLMPESVPIELLDYQDSYPPSDFRIVDQIVNEHGIVLPDGQFLFHGGLWPKNQYGERISKFVTERVLIYIILPKGCTK
ncbi:hypothetical protein ACSPAB_03635 [Buttiauxella agrestis]